jgi:hypothetical protein
MKHLKFNALLTDVLVRQLIAELTNARSRAYRDARLAGWSPQQADENVEAVSAETIRSFLSQAGLELLPAGAAVTLRRLREAALDAFGDPENCDECNAIDPDYADGCQLHTDTSVARNLIAGIEAAEDVLGPCECGCVRTEHSDCDERACTKCGCRHFRLPKVEATQ